MSYRNQSPQKMFELIAREYKPTYHFKAKTQNAFYTWKKELFPEVMRCLGDWPERIPPNPELIAEWNHDGIVKQKWIIDVQKHLSASVQINFPDNLAKGEKRSAIFCCHGHGTNGKEAIMGNDSSKELRDIVEKYRCNYGHLMAKSGFITFSIDWIGFGEHNDSNAPHFLNHNIWVGGQRDWCNLYYLHSTMLGMTNLSINIAHGKSAIDFVLSHPSLNVDKIGVMGLSAGGTMALWMTLCDERIIATEIICYSDLWADFGFRQINYCGMQVAPGLYKLVDLPDLQGLIAPQPLLVDIGVYDTCFTIDSSLKCFSQVKKIYEVAGASENLELDINPSGHAWIGNKSVPFFNKYL